MAYSNIQEDLFKSIDTIVQARIANLPYDKTIECEIIDTKKNTKGIYTVKYQNATFEANSLVGNLAVGDIVYVSVPQSDFTKEKIILTKKLDQEVQAVKILPFLKFVRGNNIFSAMQNISEYSIPVNNGNQLGRRFYFTTFDGEDVVAGYTRLGIKMTINSSIEQELMSGDFGAKITIYGYSQFDKVDSATAALNEARNKETYTEFMFTTKDMISTNPFNTHGYQNQEMVFDITGWVIDSIVVTLYQSDDFKDIHNSVIVNQRIYFTNFQLYLGYDISEFEKTNTRLFIYTKDGWLFNNTHTHKTIYSRIITKDEKENTYINSSNLFSPTFQYYWGQYNINSTDMKDYWNKYGYELIPNVEETATTIEVDIDYMTSEIQHRYCFNLRNGAMLNIHNYTSNELYFTQENYGELVYDIVEDKELEVTNIDGVLQIQGDNLLFKTKDGVTVLKLNTTNSQLIGNATTSSSSADFINDGRIHQNLRAIETAIRNLGGSYTIV